MKDNYDNLDYTKAVKFKEKFPNFNTKKYSALVHFDLTNKKHEDINAEIIQDGIERIRMEVYRCLCNIPPDQLHNELEKIYGAVKRELDLIPNLNLNEKLAGQK